MIPDKTIDWLRAPAFPRLYRLLLPAAISLVLIGSIVSYSDWLLLRNSRLQVERINRVMQSNERFLSALSDAESGQRGYLLTGSRLYLEPFLVNVKIIPGLLEALKREAPSEDRSRIEKLQSLTQGKIAEMNTSILVRDIAGPLEAVALVKQDKGRQSMEAIRQISFTLRQLATARLLRNAEDVEAHTKNSRFVIVISGLVLGSLLFTAARVIGTVERRRELLIGKLDDKRNELHTTLASVGDGLIATDMDGRVTFLNPMGVEITGWSLSEAAGKEVSDVFHVMDEHTREPIENPVAKVLRDRCVANLPSYTLLVRKDGTEVAIDDSAAPIFDNQGQLVGVVMVFRDITARRIAGRALRRWEHVFEMAAFGMAVLSKDDDPIFEQVNPALATMHGYSKEELNGKPLSTVRVTPSMPVAARGDTEPDHLIAEAQHRRKDGMTFPALADMTTVRDEFGEVLYRIGYFLDVTENRRVQAELVQSEARFRLMADSLPQFVWTSTKEGSTEYLNKRWAKETGITLEQTEGQGWTYFLYPEDRADCTEKWSRAVKSGEVFEAECRLKSAAGTMPRWYLCRSIPVRDDRGEIIRWFGSCTDIHEQKHASNVLKRSREELERANDALKRSNSDLERFAYAASHDLQEPLRMVVIYSQLLKEEYEARLDAQALLYLHFAVDGAVRMEALVRDLLSYSSASAPVETPAEGVNGEVAIRKVLANLAGSISEADAHIQVGPLPTVHLPEIHLIQIFQNLISNALKYRREGIQADIRISSRAVDGHWVFSVADNGIGMAPQYQDQVFGVFRRLHGQDRPGTGIGLALCKNLVERHGGKVWVESVLGEGSTFFFTAPG